MISKELEQAFNKLITFSMSSDESMNPNSRCAVITIALAILVCPENVEYEESYDISIRYENVKIAYSKNPTNTKIKFFPFSVEFNENGKMKEACKLLPNLAVHYSDHTNDLECIKQLRSTFHKAQDNKSKAAVLAIAWAILQRKEKSFSFCVSPGPRSGSWESIQELGVSIQEINDTIVSSTFPNWS